MDFEKYSPIVKRFAFSLTQNYATAEELTQDTMLRAVQHQETIERMSDPRGWLFRVTVNLWRDQLRIRQRRPSRQPLIMEVADVSNDPQNTIEKREELNDVLSRFQELPETQRQVLFLKTVEDRSIDEITEILGLSRNNVKVNLSLARKKMRAKLQAISMDDQK